MSHDETNRHRDDAPPGRATLGEVMELEAVEIGLRREEYRVGPQVPMANAPENLAGEGPTGLSLSGGGIRSACFSLGVLEGLDRREAAPGDPRGLSCLECFDYVSSVSGGSYAAGHLATTMLKPTPGDDAKPSWLGAVQLTSKTVPGWTWGLGVWFLGVVFQLLKTGALLVAALAALAFAMRMLDAPDAANFSAAMGLTSDVARGFVPFWLTLWAFLVGYCINSSIRHGRRWAGWWFAYFVVVSLAYVLAIWLRFPGHGPDDAASGVSFRAQYFLLAALLAPPVAACAAVGAWQLIGALHPATARRILGTWAKMKVKSRRAFRWLLPAKADRADPGGAAAAKSDLLGGPTLKQSLLAPILVALFCFAALVTTGDIGLGEAGDEGAAALHRRSQWYGELGDWIYYAACAALTVISIGLLSPTNVFRNAVFKSARRVEEYDAATGGKGRGPRRGWEPVFRVVVFLCSYGFVLLVVFVVFSTVAKENVSGYYEWRSDLPLAAFHPSDLREPDPAWERVARDARGPDGPWKPLAKKFLEARSAAGFPLVEERDRAARMRLLDSRPWVDRLLWPLAWIWSRPDWSDDNHPQAASAEAHYDEMATQSYKQRVLARRLSEIVLGWDWLYTIVPKEPVTPARTELPENWDPERYRGLGERYRGRARSLAALRNPGEALKPLDPMLDEPAEGPAEAPKAADGGPGGEIGGAGLDAAIRNNNRRALHLYFPGLMRDRRDKVVFSSIVWEEDQWMRLRIGLVALAVWALCCAVDVNTYALQKFYRGHVIDSWVDIEPGKVAHRWLHQARRGYRGWDFAPPSPGARGQGEGGDGARERRAPLLLINATLEGNRSLGHEPELPTHIFSFSPVASGFGAVDYWRVGKKAGGMTEEFARRNRLDIGNIVAISGAFLSPGTIANPALSAVLHLLNVQTGYWVSEPDRMRRPLHEKLLFHLWQSLGVDCNGDSRMLLSDGAHAENLGLYSLLRRRCRLIVVSDCSQEDGGAPEDRRFDALTQVLQQAAVERVEIGPFLSSRAYRHWLKTGELPEGGSGHPGCRHRTAIGLDLVRPAPPKSSAGKAKKPEGDGEKSSSTAAKAPEEGAEASEERHFSQEHYLFARIRYPGGARGLVVYLRPTITGDEGDTLLHVARHSQFPNDDPVDQFYTPARMNTYRLLGRHIADELMDDPVMEDVIAAILTGGDVAPPLEYKPGGLGTDLCRKACGEGASCSANLPRSFRREYLNARTRHEKERAAMDCNGERHVASSSPTSNGHDRSHSGGGHQE
ncbi:hypothetical protein [Paludisphaera sp.]|uniref:hypothetical protein n=1 Tax=Paludisphaera sp. TaxID=2017432 RepID=UPI00301CB4DF